MAEAVAALMKGRDALALAYQRGLPQITSADLAEPTTLLILLGQVRDSLHVAIHGRVRNVVYCRAVLMEVTEAWVRLERSIEPRV